MTNNTDLPEGYRWATPNELERADAIVVPRTTDSEGNLYTLGEADIAVPIRTVSQLTKHYLAEMEGAIWQYRNWLVIKDNTGRQYRLERSLLLGGNTDTPRVVLQIREINSGDEDVETPDS